MDNRKKDRELEHTTPELINPYHPYDLESGDWFYHGDVIKQIKQIFETHPENRFVLLSGSPGSGKTSTLKQIEKSPDLLGKKYVPIYLNSRNYIDLEPDDLLFVLYKDVVEKLNQVGYEIPKPDYIKKRRQKGYTLESLVLTVDSYVEKAVLVLIFDEFDSLLQNIDVQIIADYIQFYKYIEKSWSNYGLILTGDKSLIHPTQSEIINQFLNAAFKINLDEILKEEQIKKLIIIPVKNQLSYSDDAIQRILWYSGENLYFQQLICFYIVEYLQEKQKNRCLARDVEEVIQRILDDDRKEFVSAWENKLSVKTKLIASALADDNITEKRGGHYFLKDNSLLDDVLGKEIYNEIEKLQNLGYTNKMKNRQFTEFPIKIPLYGMWIKKEHSFIKTIIENIEIITEKVDLKALIQGIEQTRDEELILFDKKTILQIARKWTQLAHNITRGQGAQRNQIESFYENLARLINLDIKARWQSNENYFAFDLRNLNIGTLDEAFCFIQNSAELTQADIKKIERIATAVALDTQTKLTLFFYFQKSQMVEDVVKKTYLNLIAMGEDHFKRIILSRRPIESFRNIILSGLSLHRVSLYQTEGPARATFYGRSDIINRIIGSPNKSFSIVGARKIGKSSLLHRIKDQSPPNTIYLFLNLEVDFLDARNYKNFLISLEREIKRVFKIKAEFSGFFGRKLTRLPEVIQLLPLNGKKIVFIFDEIDNLIEFDKKNKYKLIRIFRTLSQNNYCQFIFAGFKTLYHTRRDIDNPLYNFCDEIILDPLDREAALDLVTKPMESIGVQYENMEDKEPILAYTGNHPNLIQFFCKELIEKIEKHDKVEDRRIISKKDIEDLYDEKYKKYILNDVYMFFSDLSELNQLILMLLVEKPSGESHFSLNEIRNSLIDKGLSIPPNVVHQNIRNLVVRFILIDPEVDKYCFALPAFPDILKNSIDENYKKRIIKEIKANV